MRTVSSAAIRSIRNSLIALVFAIEISGCHGDSSTAPEASRTPRVSATPRFSMLLCNESMSASQCDILERGIHHLTSHPDPFCRQLGFNAFRRNGSNRYLYQYEYDPGSTIQAWSGGSGADGAAWISSHGFAGDGGTNVAGLSGHEEYHLAFPDDPQGETHAVEWEAYCGNGFVNNP